MKKLLGLVLIFNFFVTVFGQETINNFQIIEKEIVWQKLFEADITFEQLVEKVRISGILQDYEVSENIITGNLKPLDANYKGAGYREMNTAMYVSRSHFTGFAIIEYREGRYRVTLKRIQIIQKYDTSLIKQGVTNTLEFFGLTRRLDAFTNSFKKEPSIILDFTFTKELELSSPNNEEIW